MNLLAYAGVFAGLTRVALFVHLGLYYLRGQDSHARQSRHPPRRLRATAGVVLQLLRHEAGRLADGPADVRLPAAVEYSGLGRDGLHLGHGPDDGHRGGDVRLQLAAGAGGARGRARAVCGEPVFPPQDSPHVADRAKDEFADHGRLQRGDCRRQNDEGVCARSGEPARLRPADRRDARALGPQFRAVGRLFADHPDARQRGDCLGAGDRRVSGERRRARRSARS